MKKISMLLTDSKIKNSKPTEKAFKLPDGKGLFLLVHPNGSKYWRLRYSFGRKEKLLSLGLYPDISLAEARNKQYEARRQIANGIDPSVLKKASKQAAKTMAENSFEAVAREWYAKYSPRWALSHSQKTIRRLERDIFPWLGSRPIAEITPPEVLATLRRTESRTLDTAHRARHSCNQVFKYAIATGRAENNPAIVLQGAMPPVKTKHFPTILEPSRIGELLRAIEGYSGNFIVKSALRLLPLLFVRPIELRTMEWAEIDFEKAEWRIKAEKMKGRVEHLVPLSSQAIAILQEIQPVTGSNQYVFSGVVSKSRFISENTINHALRRIGFVRTELTGHSFRSMARTLLEETLGYRSVVIELQLAHAMKGPLGATYNRSTFLQERKRMMQKWSDYLNELKTLGTILPFTRREANND